MFSRRYSYLARATQVSVPDVKIGTFDGEQTVPLLANILGELAAPCWQMLVANLPNSALTELADAALAGEQWQQVSIIYLETCTRLETGEHAERERTTLSLLKNRLEREESLPRDVAEARQLIEESVRLADRLQRAMFAIREPQAGDIGEKVDGVQAREAEEWQAREYPNPAKGEGGGSQVQMKAGPRGKR